jgi:hypothetical protein
MDQMWIGEVVSRATGRNCVVKWRSAYDDYEVSIFGSSDHIYVSALIARERNKNMLADFAKRHMAAVANASGQPLAPEAEKAGTDGDWLRLTIAEVIGCSVESVFVSVVGNSHHVATYPGLMNHAFSVSEVSNRDRDWVKKCVRAHVPEYPSGAAGPRLAEAFGWTKKIKRPIIDGPSIPQENEIPSAASPNCASCGDVLNERYEPTVDGMHGMCAERTARLREAERPKAMGVDPYTKRRLTLQDEHAAMATREHDSKAVRVARFTADSPPPSEFREKFPESPWPMNGELEL